MEEEYQRNTQSPSQLPLNELAQGLFSNPELLQKIRGILGTVSNQASVTEADTALSSLTEKQQTHESTAPQNSISSDGLASLLSNPEILEKLPSVLAAIKPVLSSLPPPAPSPTKESGRRSAPDCRNDLLLSLKPFLSNQRQDAVDAILRIAKLSTLLGQIK